MKINRKAVAIGLAASAVIAISLLVFIKILVDRNSGRLVQEIEKNLGRTVTFDQLRLSLWGGLGLSVTHLRVAEDQRFAATPLIQTKELKLQLGWLPLLLGHVEVKRLVLDEPEIQIIRNEAGNLNLLAFAVPKESQREAEAKERRMPSTPRFRVSSIRVANGKIYYVDRSLKEPAEVLIRNVDMDLTGPTFTGRPKIKVAANLFVEGQRQNVSLKGRIGPLQGERIFAQQSLDLQVRADPLLLPQLTRAIPSLRERADFYLGITGPATLKARLTGTLERPRITDLNLTGAVLGSTEDNVSVSGEWDFSQAASWTEGKIKGKVTVNPVSLDQLRKLGAVKRALPSSLLSTGLLSVTVDLQGPWDDLNVQALIKARDSDIQYGEWLKKVKGTPAEIELKGKRLKDRIVLEGATVTLHNMKLLLSGLFEAGTERFLTLKLRSERTDLSGWNRLVPWLSSYTPSGNLRLDLSIKKKFSLRDGNVEIRGNVDLADVRLKDKKGGRSIERMNASVSFGGREARIENGFLRLGFSDLFLEASLRDFSQAVVRYTLRSPKLNLGDLTGLAAYKTDEMKTVISTGDMDFGREKTRLRGNLTSAEGVLQELPYRNLHGEISWSSGNLSFRNVSLQALSGTLRGAGGWETGAENSQRLALEPHIENVDLKPLLVQKFPGFKEHIDGRLNLNAKLLAASRNGVSLQDDMQGQGDTQVLNGTLKDFNLVELVLSNIKGLPGMSDLVSSRFSSRYSAMFQRSDTPFNSLTATFAIDKGRILSKDFHMATPDYSVYGDGWVGFDKSMKWNATLVMSSQFTRELMQEHRNVRYVLNRQGRLAIPFRLEGTLPRVQAKPDVQKLAEVIQQGFLAKGKERSSGGEQVRGGKGTKKKPTTK